jgi:hypothetical protein
MSERFNVPDSKSGVLSKVPGVRIPLSPQNNFNAWRSRAFLFYSVAEQRSGISGKIKMTSERSEQALKLIWRPPFRDQ